MLIDDTECPNPSSYAAGPLPSPVERWKYIASINYLSERQIRESEVKVAAWYKNVDSLEHEYLVLECHRPEEAVFFLRIERQPANHREFTVAEESSPSDTRGASSLWQHLARKNPCKRALWILLQKVSHNLRPKVAAMDTVSQVFDSAGSFGENAREIGRYWDFRKPLFVRDIAFLSSIVHSHQPNYELFLHQCYWYCRTIVDVVTDIYRPAGVDVVRLEEAGTYTITKGWLGSHRFTVNHRCDNEVDRIRRDFKAAVKSHNGEVRQRENERNGKREELERRLREMRRREGLSGSHGQEVVLKFWAREFPDCH